MTLNWIDWIIILFIMYEIYDGWERGFTSLLANLFSFLGSLWFAVRFHGVVGNFFVEKFGIASAWTDVLGYITVALLSQIVIDELLDVAVARLPEKFQKSKMNQWLGGLLSSVNASIIVSFILLLILALPLRGTVKKDIRNSFIGSRLVMLSERYGGQVKSSLEDLAKEAVKFLTVKPGSNERIPLDIPSVNVSFTVDQSSESEMVRRVNQERVSRGMPELRVDTRITAVARGKSRDMFERKYFSHYDPDGKNAADRMTAAGVAFSLVGENLAYAPDVDTAHEGLMNSEGHRANILEPRFHRIGIGVIDGGVYGQMYTQIFAD
ncbi:MAG TPA: CvpA family protein [Patescibacteria group bacterium]|nr:CvpA family protein [Patescibacteria group bacterium]